MLPRFVLIAGLMTMGLWAQGPGGARPDPAAMIQFKVSRLTSALNLTPAQQSQATTLYSDAATAVSDLRSTQQSTRASLDAAITRNDAATIDALASTLGSLSGQMLSIESKADAAFYAILNAGQQAAYVAMPHGGGPGGGPRPMSFGPARTRSLREQ